MTKIIAIVDDEEEMEVIYSCMLEDVIQQEQVRIKFFSDSRLFELWLKYNTPDLILSDISMPHLSGVELGHRIRENGSFVPTYFVSGHDEEDFKEPLKDFVNYRYVSKPIHIEKFVHLVKSDLSLQS